MNRSALSKIVILLTFSLVLVSCSSDDDNPTPQETIELDLLEFSTEQPAKVKLFFKAKYVNGIPIAGLEAENFTISENDVEISQSESLAQIQRDTGEFLFSSVLLLDLSGSVLNEDTLPVLKASSISFIESVIPTSDDPYAGSYEMAIYWFDGEEYIHELIPFSTSRQGLIQAINSINQNISNDNSTNLNGAVVQGIDLAQNRLEEISVDQDISTASSLVIFTDGTDQAGRVSDSETIDAVQTSGQELTIFTIGLGSEINETILSSFGKSGSEFVNSDSDLNQTFQIVANLVRDEANSFYILEYCSPKRSGTHTLSVKLDIDNAFGEFESEFSAQGFSGRCSIE